jgi:hypothetical protein
MKPDEFFALMIGLTLGAGLIMIGLQTGSMDQSKQLTVDDFKEVKKDAGTSDVTHN